MTSFTVGNVPVARGTSRQLHWVIGEGVDVDAFSILLSEFLGLQAGVAIAGYNIVRSGRYFCCHRLGWERVSQDLEDGLTPVVAYHHFGQFLDWYEQEQLGYSLDTEIKQYLWFVLPSDEILQELRLEERHWCACLVSVSEHKYRSGLGLGYVPFVLPRPPFYHEWCQALQTKQTNFWGELSGDWALQLEIVHWRAVLYRQFQILCG